MPNNETLNFIKKTIKQQIYKIEMDDFTLNIPTINSLKIDIPKMEFHLAPELVMQIKNTSTICFPHEEIAVNPGEIAIIPPTMPHVEVCKRTGEDFLNVVMMFQTNSFSLHIATTGEEKNSFVRCTDIYCFESYHLQTLETCLNDAVTFYHKQDSYRPLKGLLLATFSIIDNILQTTDMSERIGNRHVLKCLDLVQAYLLKPNLTVKFLAQQLNLSPDYLSNLFVNNQNMTLIEHINQQRMATACKYLKHTSLNISEISRACGYSDPAYFARIFRKHYKMSPQQYRSSL